MTTPKSERKRVRYQALHTQFLKMHNKRAPHDKFEKYILELVIKLGEVYDEVMDEVHVLCLTEYGEQSRQRKILSEREQVLDKIGHLLRTAIHIAIPDTKETKDASKRTTRLTQSDDEDLLSDL